MKMKELRERKHLSRKELAGLTGISYCSIQDYEQGHKELASAKGDTLYRLSVALGCDMEELLEEQIIEVHLELNRGDDRESTQKQTLDRLEKYYIEMQKIYSEETKISGRWKFIEDECFLVFLYDGEIVFLPFHVVFKKELLKWLVQVAALMIDSYVENVEMERQFSHLEGSLWDYE